MALSEVSKKRATDSLLGFGSNIKIISNYLDKIKEKCLGSKTDGTQKTIKDIMNEEFGQMKFDVVIGNPPYQENTGGGRGNLATDIFDKFILLGDEIGTITCMITPSKWVNKNSLSSIKQLMCSGHVYKLVHYTNSRICFNGIDIAGGVSYFITDDRYDGMCIVVNISNDSNISEYKRLLNIGEDIILDNKAYSIISKLGNFKRFEPTSGDNPFGIYSYEIGNLIQKNPNDAILMKSDGISFFDRKELKNQQLIDTYKVTIGKMNPDRGGVNDSTSWNVINKPNQLKKGWVIAQNYMILFSSINQDEANNFYKWSKTKFFRFMALQGLSGASLSTKETWRFVPLQDFTSNSDIDWSQSISNIDQQLYKKYNFTQEEIDYIESTIKPME